MASMTIGPAIIVGGNKVEMKTNGKIQVTNEEGKVKTMSQDQFKKKLVKNADKLNNGENIEFKNDNKTGLIVGGAVATAAIATGIIFRKDISKYMKDFSWKKLGQDIKGLFGKAKDKVKTIFNNKKATKTNVFDGTMASPRNKAEMQTARETLKLKNQANAATGNKIARDFETNRNKTLKNHNKRQKELEVAFANYTPPEV